MNRITLRFQNGFKSNTATHRLSPSSTWELVEDVYKYPSKPFKTKALVPGRLLMPTTQLSPLAAAVAPEMLHRHAAPALHYHTLHIFSTLIFTF